MSDFVWGLIIGFVILLFIMPIGKSEGEENKIEVSKPHRNRSNESNEEDYVNDSRFYYMPCNMYNSDD